jgi:hypothetical protein
MDKINGLFELEILKVVEAFPSIYTKDDVVSLLNVLRTNTLNEAAELKPTVGITENQFQSFSRDVNKSLEDEINRGNIEVYDTSSAEFSINYNNQIELDNLDILTDNITDEVHNILLDQFQSHFGNFIINLKTVLDEIFLEGGVSYNVTTGEVNPKSGYMVSILGFEKQYDLDTIKANDLREYVLDNAYDLWGENRFIGGWIDKDTNKVVLDVSVNITDVTNACYTGIINKQKCIYDCSNKRTISLPSPQTAGTEVQKKAYAKMKAQQLAYLLETTGVE